MGEVEKLHEEKRMEGRRLNEDEEDWKATLWYDLEKEMEEIFEQFNRKKQSMGTIGHFARRALAIETKYQKAGLSLEDIQKVRKEIVRGELK